MSSDIKFGKDVKIDDTTKIGIYSDIGDRCNFRESIIGDYAVCRGENLIWYSEIGKFSSIAYGARINAVNHPAFTRIAQHRFTYILIVTHNGVCRAIGAYFNGIPNDGNLSLYAHNNCEIKKYSIK